MAAVVGLARRRVDADVRHVAGEDDLLALVALLLQVLLEVGAGEGARQLFGDDLLAALGRQLVELGREPRLGREDGRAVGDRVHDVHDVGRVAGRAVFLEQRRDGAARRIDVFGLEDAWRFFGDG